MAPPSGPGRATAMSAWHLFVARLCRRLYYSRVTVLGAERLPMQGPVLFVALHRNGAVDGCVYASVLPPAVFMISTQLTRSPIGRLFFTGIEVVREKDRGDRSRNRRAIQECLDLLARGGRLVVMPEGTSSLGPRHLPFQPGAARIASAALAAGVPLAVVPLGVHYERAWAFRSRVEVVVGHALETVLAPELDEERRVATLHERIAEGLESVGAQFESAAAQEQCEQLAYVATLATERNYFDSLKQLETGIPTAIREAAARVGHQAGRKSLLRHQGVPLCPMGPVALYAALLVVLTPVVTIAALSNLPPLAAAWWAGRHFPDDRNVVALWRLLVGLPALLGWALVVIGISITVADWRGAAVYAVATLAGIQAWYRYKKLAVAVVNGLRFPSLTETLLGFRETVIRELGHGAR